MPDDNQKAKARRADEENVRAACAKPAKLAHASLASACCHRVSRFIIVGLRLLHLAPMKPSACSTPS